MLLIKNIVIITYYHLIIRRNITELRKGEFEEVTTGQLNANIIRLPSSTTNGGSVSIDDQTVELVPLNLENLGTLANKITETNIVRFGNKIFADTISRYNEFKLEFDNHKYDQTITNIHIGEACVDRWRSLRKNHIL